MADEGFKRKLTAILSADAVGYSRLMREDEESTVRDIAAHRVLISDIVQQHHGRVIDSPGDNILAEFASVVDAVNGAIKIQEEIKRSNTDTPKDRRMEFRIGINLGDVIEEEERIYGDGVNIAARVEGLAAGGGIAISGTVYEHIKEKLSLGYHYLGEQDVKNISEPVRVYRLLTAPPDAGKMIGAAKTTSKRRRLWAVSAAVVVAIVALGVWQFYMRRPTIEPASVEKLAFPLPDKPSIAVLPFVNMSNDPEQEYFSDGMTDELISDLAKIKDILVISRNSAFTYKGKSIKVQQIAKDLKVRYILEGSVQRSGNQVRIRAQLIDGETDHHLWSESYDGVMDDIFELQDKITDKIVSALSVTLTSDEQDRITEKGTDSIPAYDAYLKGVEHYSRMTGDNLLKAIRYYREAVKIDPNFSRAYSGLAAAYYMSTSFNFPWESQIKIMWDIMNFRIKARHYLNRAMKNPTWEAYVVKAHLDIARKRFDEAVSSAEKAFLMAPNEYLTNIAMGQVLNCVGRADEALKYLDVAMRLDPRFLDISLVEKGKAFFLLDDFAKAVDSIQRGITLNPALTNYSSFEAASHAFLGKIKDAENAWHRFAGGFPAKEYLTTKYLYDFFPFKDYKVFDRFIDGLNKAGFEGNPSDYYRVEKKNRLSGQKIKELLFGKIAICFNPAISSIEKVSYQWTAAGDFEFSCPAASILDKGKSQIEGNSICNQFEYLYDGIKVCMDVYYITDGNDAAKNQYLYFGDSWLTTISVKE